MGRGISFFLRVRGWLVSPVRTRFRERGARDRGRAAGDHRYPTLGNGIAASVASGTWVANTGQSDETTFTTKAWREFPSGLVPAADGPIQCVRCERQAELYVLDLREDMWFSCLDHHATTSNRPRSGSRSKPGCAR